MIINFIMPLSASIIMIGTSIYTYTKLKERYTNALLSLIYCISIWQLLIGLEQFFAYNEKLDYAVLSSQISGLFAQLIPAFIFLFVLRFVNIGIKLKIGYIVLLICFISGLFSPWGIAEYKFVNGEYITKPGMIYYIHMVLFFTINMISIVYFLWKRFIDSNMSRLETQKANIFIVGLFFSILFGGVFSFFFRGFYYRMAIGSFSPTLLLITALAGKVVTRKFIFKSYNHIEQPVMPDHIYFQGAFNEERKAVFRKFGIYMELKSDVENYVKDALINKKYIYPEDIEIPSKSENQFPLAIIYMEKLKLYSFIQSKYDGIVKDIDIKNIQHVFNEAQC